MQPGRNGFFSAVAALVGGSLFVLTPSAHAGGCIAPDGACYETTGEECYLVGGVYLGDDSSCQGLPNAQQIGAPTGACCLPGGFCDEIDDDDLMPYTAVSCAVDGGTFQLPDSQCVEDPDGAGGLPPLVRGCTGACCLPDETCRTDLTNAECLAIGGEYLGNDISCFDFHCEVYRGACCLPDGSCDFLTLVDCETAGGFWQGEGSACADGPCTGNCCLPDGTCQTGQSINDCNGLGGAFQGWSTWSPIVDANCPPPGEKCYKEWQRIVRFGRLGDVSETASELDKFDRMGDTRELTRVELHIQQGLYSSLIWTNRSNLPKLPSTFPGDFNVNASAQNTEFFTGIAVFPLLIESVSTGFGGVEPPLFCDVYEYYPANFSCDYGSFATGRPQEFSDAFIADPNLLVPSEFEQSGGDTTFEFFNFFEAAYSVEDVDFNFRERTRVQSILEVVYEFAPLGACCLCDGCTDAVTQEDCNNEPLFVSWHEAEFCADITCPPLPDVDIIACPGEPPLPDVVCPGEQEIPFCAEVVNIDALTDPDTGYGVGAEPPLDLTPFYTWEITGDATFCDGTTMQSGFELDQVCVDAADITPDCDGQFTLTVTVRVGNCEDTTFIVVDVVDDEAPSITCPPDLELECGVDPIPPAAATPADFIGQGGLLSDNCADPDELTVALISETSDGGICPETITRVYRVTDPCGNFDDCTQLIVIDDTLPPAITCPPNITIECDEDTSPANTGSASATDECDSDVAITFNDVIIPGDCPDDFIIERTWTAEDDCGNTDACLQIITVQDTTPPVITCPPDVDLECDESTDPANTGFASAIDNCDGDPAITFEDVTIPGDCPDAFTIERTWRAEDDCGNFDVCVQLINVDDTTPPDIVCPPDVEVNCDDPTDPAATGFASATDNCDDDPTVTFEDDIVPGVCPQEFVIERTWTAEDDCGNTEFCIQLITVVDEEPPVIMCPPDLDLECGVNPVPPAADAPDEFLAQGGELEDNCAPVGDLIVTLLSETSDGAICPETITRTYEVCDPCGNCTTCVQTIVINDTLAPMCTNPPDGPVLDCLLGETPPDCPPTVQDYIDLGGTVSDACWDIDDLTIVCNDELIGDCPDQRWERTFTITDPCGNFTTCVQVFPCAPLGSCCFCDGTCEELTQLQCEELMDYDLDVWAYEFTPCVACDDLTEPCEAVGACCVPPGVCQLNVTEQECLDLGGEYYGDCTSECPDCETPRYGCQEKGSLLIFSKVEVRWNAAGELTQDTFISLTNDFNAGVRVQMYFINGDEPLPFDPDSGERPHPGWNWVDNEIFLTADQPTYWSAHSGLPATGAVSPWEVLDPGTPPGRPAPDGSGDRVLRGFIILWAVDSQNRQISWNHLSGLATLVRYDRNLAWEYTPCAFQVVDDGVPHGGLVGTPGVIKLNGAEYAVPADYQIMNFQAQGDTSYTPASMSRVVETISDVTIHPISADLRQETEGPPITKAHFDFWDQNETKRSTFRCITCWDQTLLTQYDGSPFDDAFLPTSFLYSRIDGQESINCEGSQAHALLGLHARLITMDGVLTAASGTNMFGAGIETAEILYDVLDGPPTMPFDPSREQLIDFAEYFIQAGRTQAGSSSSGAN